MQVQVSLFQTCTLTPFIQLQLQTMLPSLRIASRHATSTYPRTCRLMSSNVHFPSPSNSQTLGDPRPSGSSSGGGSTGTGNTEQPPSSSNKSDSHPDQQQQQQQQAKPMIPSAAASPPPPPPPPPSESQSHPYAGAKEYAENQEAAAASKNAVVQSNLPALPQQGQNSNAHIHAYATPPFDTHRFFKALVKTFSEPIASSLMRAMRALLVDRTGKVKREAVSIKDLENVSIRASSMGLDDVNINKRTCSIHVMNSKPISFVLHYLKRGTK